MALQTGKKIVLWLFKSYFISNNSWVERERNFRKFSPDKMTPEEQNLLTLLQT